MREKLLKRELCIILASVLLMLSMIVIMPATANAEDYYYDVHLTEDQEENLDFNELIKGEKYATFYVDGHSADEPMSVEYNIYLNNGLIRVCPPENNSYKIEADIPVFSWYGANDNLSNVDKVTAKYISGKLLISTYYNSIDGMNVVVLSNGESKTIYKNEINQGELLVTHTGNPTGRETLHQIKIKADGSEDPRRDDFWNSSESYWLTGYYGARSINPEPFRADHYADSAKTIDNWWEEDYGASYIIVSYSEENGFTFKYVWGEYEEEADDSSEEHKTEPVHTHSYEWVTISEPTINSKGRKELICTTCGDVAEVQYVGNDTVVYESYINNLEAQLKTVTSDKGVLLELGDWHSVPGNMMESIINSDVDVELTYRYKGQDYDIVIPAGKGIDLHIPWYGPLLMYSLYGK